MRLRDSIVRHHMRSSPNLAGLCHRDRPYGRGSGLVHGLPSQFIIILKRTIFLNRDEVSAKIPLQISGFGE